MQLARLPRIFLDRLTEALGGPGIWIRRDHCSGHFAGGDKTRKLEYPMAEAEATGADMVMTQGATRLTHARQTAAFAGRPGQREAE